MPAQGTVFGDKQILVVFATVILRSGGEYMAASFHIQAFDSPFLRNSMNMLDA